MRRMAALLLSPWLAVSSGRVAAAGESWPPISAEVWALRDDPAVRAAGAVVLENRIAFHSNRIEYTYRVRIVGPQGRDAAEVPGFPGSAYGFDGRTVHADGTSVRFSEKKDFQTTRVVSRPGRLSLSRLVPPGVDGDCVVELRWYESAQEGFGPLPPEYGFFHQWTFASPYRTLLTVVEIPSTFPWAYQLATGDAERPEVKNGVYTMRDLRAVEPTPPFALESLRTLPQLTIFWQSGDLDPYVSQGPAAFWNTVGRLVQKNRLGRVSKGSEYAAFAREILAGLPEGPRRKAVALRERLDSAIVNQDYLTIAERTQLSEKEAKARITASDLDAAIRRRRTTGFGMLLLFLNLARDAGLDPAVALVADREERIFRPSLLAAYQLDHYLVGIPETGKATLWLDPTIRFGGGLILPGYQGTAALQLDLDQWTLRPISIPVQPGSYNVRRHTFEVDLGEEQDRFTVKAEFAGYPEREQRSRYSELERIEQARELKKYLERNLSGAEVTRTEVSNAQLPDADLSWSAEGRFEIERPERRTVSPFPSMYWPVDMPKASDLGGSRNQPIVMPYLQQHTARSTIRYPAGYRLHTGDPMEHANALGSVSLSMRTSEPRTVEVVLRVEITRLMLPAESYADLKDFLGWMREACGRSFVLEREP